MKRKVLRRTLAAIVAATTVLATAGCAIDHSGAGRGDDVIRIAYQAFPSGDLVVKNQRLLERALPGRTIKWVKFDSGADVNTAFLAGEADFGAIGSAPVARGLSAPLNIGYRVAFVLDVGGDNEALVARKGTGITSVADLRGKRVATAFASTAHYSLLAALAEAGLNAGDVTLVDLQPQASLAAWQRGDADTVYTWLPTLDELRRDGTTLITSRELAARGKPTLDLGVVSSTFADAHPDVVDVWRRAELQAVDLIRADPTSAARAVAAELGTDQASALAQLRQGVFLSAADLVSPAWLGTQGRPGRVAESLQSAAQFLADQHQIPESPGIATLRDAVYTEGLPHVITGD